MKTLLSLFLCLGVLGATGVSGQPAKAKAGNEAAARPSTVPADYGVAPDASPALQIPAGTKPLIDYWMRDVYVTLGPDGYYYLTGTTAVPGRDFGGGSPHCWDWNDGIYLWRSKDLKHWKALGRVWSLDRDATWQHGFKKTKPFTTLTGDHAEGRKRAVWAPELHYIKSATNWFLVACMNDSAGGHGSFILRSESGRAEGPYKNIAGNAHHALFPQIDGSLFEDDDGTVWFVGHNHFYARMKPDMSGLAGPIRRFRETPYHPEPYCEGAYVFKYGGKYHLIEAIWSFKMPDGSFTYDESARKRGGVRWSYDCVIADSDHFEGPYGPRYTAGVGMGHDNLFKDKHGRLWATLFGNPRSPKQFKQPFLCRPAIVPMRWHHGRFVPIEKLY